MGEAVLDVGAAVLVPEAVGAQGGRQVVVVGLGEDVLPGVEVVLIAEGLVAEGIGTQVVVGLGAVDDGVVDVGVDEVVEVEVVDGVGSADPGSVFGGTWVTAGTEVAGALGVTSGLAAVGFAGVEPGRRATSLPAFGLVLLTAAAAVRDFAVVSLTGATAEAGRVFTPWRYASAMAITMLT